MSKVKGKLGSFFGLDSYQSCMRLVRSTRGTKRTFLKEEWPASEKHALPHHPKMNRNRLMPSGSHRCGVWVKRADV